ncbi:hypothetical protein N2152v2_001974 [Parachlorella kessleri]
MEDKEANNKEAVWNLLGRHSKVGKELFKLYYQGAQTGADVGNRYSDHNLEAYRKKLAAGWTPPKPVPLPKPVPKSRAYVDVPPPRIQKPHDPWALAGVVFGGKKPLAAIQREQQSLETPLPEPKGPLLDEAAKQKLMLHMEYAGRVPPALQELMEAQQAQRLAAAGSGMGQQGGGAKEQMMRMFIELSTEVHRKQEAVRAAGSEAEADKLRREIRVDLAHIRRLDGMMAKVEAL